MKTFLAIAALGFAGLASATGTLRDTLAEIAARPNVRLPYFAVWRADAVATVVLFSGGGGGYGNVKDPTDWPRGNNFLIRTAAMFGDRPLNVVIPGRSSDTPSLDWHVRTSPEHIADNLALLREVKRHAPTLPIWIVGTSRGTVSAAATAIADVEGLAGGLVLTSSVVDSRKNGNLPSQSLGRITVPTLVLHHEHDACKACSPSGVSWIMRGLSNTPIKAQVMVSGGEDQAEGDPCEGMHTHGFRGIERKVVDKIIAWIMNPQSK
jgi:pimeloyl-ACP methyl ester carboxylesterase